MKVETITLELLRAGPAHGQLLSPLTQYIALCGESGPADLRIDVEHFDLLHKLGRLRYELDDGTPVDEGARQQALRELGALMQRVLADVVTLPAELGRAAGIDCDLVHLRLVMAGAEVALLPFELAVAPRGYPGEGVELVLQRRVPIVMTREARRGRALPMRWNRRPRVLFAHAAPGTSSVPHRAHLEALRSALAPWIAPDDDPEREAENTRELLVELPDATLRQLADACRDGDFTHVHLLAHGAELPGSHGTRFGIHLARGRRAGGEVVPARRLAQAMQPALRAGDPTRRPAVVSLATCDSANVGDVSAPGASLAHELQAFGVPIVFASQFPLTKAGSTEFTRALYAGLLRGDDPRQLLHTLRERLRVGGSVDHDWAALVAFTSLPSTFSADVRWFRASQARRAIEVQLGRAEQRFDEPDVAEAALDAAEVRLAEWRDQLEREARSEERGVRVETRELLVECYGVAGATAKRRAEIEHRRGDARASSEQLGAALSWYRQALAMDPTAHWPVGQYLAMLAALGGAREPAMHDSATEWARRQLDAAERGERAWAHGTLAELGLLGVHHHNVRAKAEKEAIAADVEGHCAAIVDLMGRDAFHVLSTRRQFERYANWWKSRRWSAIARRALAVFAS